VNVVAQHRSRKLTSVADGLAAGLLGALIVATVHFIHDLAFSTPLRTPTVLDALVFQGVDATRGVEPSFASIVRFSAVHLGSWAVAGITASLAVAYLERHIGAWYAVFGGISVVFVLLLYLGGLISIPGDGVMHLWLGTIFGATGMTTLIIVRHPALLSERTGASQGEHVGLEAALAMERRCRTIHESLIRQPPFGEALAGLSSARERRIHELAELCQRYAIEVPESDPRFESEDPSSLQEGLNVALEAEHEAVDLYDRKLVSAVEPAIRDVFLRNRWESHDEHLRILEDCMVET
jgi:hypothetical protein